MKASLIIVLIAFPIYIFGQNEMPKNVIYFELFGNSDAIISANYAKIIAISKNDLLHLDLRGGFSISTKPHDSSTLYLFPIETSLLIGKYTNFIETGIGWTSHFGTSNVNNPNLPVEDRKNFYSSYFLRIGYRYMKNNGLLLRVAPMAEFYNLSDSIKVQFAFGVSLGVAFATFKGLWNGFGE